MVSGAVFLYTEGWRRGPDSQTAAGPSLLRECVCMNVCLQRGTATGQCSPVVQNLPRCSVASETV
jgi:hypothetical protein